MEDHLKRGNLLWEGSRMFLPEQREQLLERRRNQSKHDRLDLDEDQFAIIDGMIAESLHNKTEITLTVYDPYQYRQLTGYVVRVDQQRGRILMQRADGDEWVEWGALIGAEREESP